MTDNLPRRSADAEQREAALDTATSFIVQAPAGSGKTELLIQRYLALLAVVEEPEQIAAITFTRKAAGEMLARVMGALARGADPTPPAHAHHATTWRLARAALARDQQCHWQLAGNPARLRIQTIDSLCASLTRQMPLLARFGAQPGITEEARPLHLLAAANTLALLEDDADYGDAIARLLAHLDNDVGVVQGLLADMLARRDQWLRHLRRGRERAALEAAFQRLRAAMLQRTARAAATVDVRELGEIARYAAANLALTDPESPLLALEGMNVLPGPDESDLPAWLGLAQLLLTGKGEWRKQVNKNTGFPSEGSKAEKELSKAMKGRFAALQTGHVDREDHDELRDALHQLRAMPPGEYSPVQWEVLEAMLHLLPRAVAELWRVFAAEGECDFSEVAQAAGRALGSDEAPTDLALALDYRIHHLLIDEFQDTSVTQFQLVEQLTRGWQPDEGRTLFLVGDPMQSIYRFREAEVGLFLKARQSGIGAVRLTPLTLTVNFRSQAGIVSWVNQAFRVSMPAQEDIAAGAVSYTDADAHQAAAPGEAVSLHVLFADQPEREAARVVALIRAALQANPEGDIALLVRKRSQLAEIVPALKVAGIAFRALDIDPLVARPVVRDLLALTRVISHPADRIAWLAALRAPWCGLVLGELEILARDAGRAILDNLRDPAVLAQLPAAAGIRLERFLGVLLPVLALQRRTNLHTTVEQCWLRLGGPAALEASADLEDARRYLDHLAQHETAGQLPDLTTFEATLDKLHAAPSTDPAARVQIMTIHKAKGLEFDTVIVPGLERRGAAADKQLMVWVERPRAASEAGDAASELLLAPVRETGGEDDGLYAAVIGLEKQRQAHERTRLAYVAATRARDRLHLVATLKRAADKEGVKINRPGGDTLLNALWPALGEAIEAQCGQTPLGKVRAPDTGADSVPNQLRRLPVDWELPAPGAALHRPASLPPAPETAIDFDWASPVARHVGTVTHRFLQWVAEKGLAHWDATRIGKTRPAIERELQRWGTPGAELSAAASQVQDALQRALADERGRWVLDAHPQAQAELRLTGHVGGVLKNVVLDRTFVTADGKRWIIDFKTGAHEGGDVEAFLDREQQRYRPQLETYARLVGQGQPVELGLYFPLLGGWRHWTFDGP